MGNTYNPVVQEDESDLKTLGSQDYQLQVAKCVANPPDTPPTFNVVYASKMLAPNMDVSWQTQYGLNWSTNVPAKGAKVEYSGFWQAGMYQSCPFFSPRRSTSPRRRFKLLMIRDITPR